MAGRKYPKADEVQIDGNRIFSPVRKKWLPLTPEEQVRQQYLTVLIDEYGYSLDQIDEEVNVTGRGAAQARADFLIWRTAQDKTDSKAPFIVVECKSDNVSIKPADYTQGENYARIADAPFFVTHNSRETRFWRVKKDRMPGYIEEIENIPHANASDKEIKELLEKLRINAEVLHGERAEYGKQIVVSLADELVVLYGKSFEAKNLRRMMQFAECFPDIEIVVPLARQLSWTHFRALISPKF